VIETVNAFYATNDLGLNLYLLRLTLHVSISVLIACTVDLDLFLPILIATQEPKHNSSV
jgi:hypothetical protein